jgi:hypothetical protein
MNTLIKKKVQVILFKEIRYELTMISTEVKPIANPSLMPLR